MSTSTFDAVSRQYADTSLVQQQAAGKLMRRLAIKPADRVIDIACGPGNVTAALQELTDKRVTGIDISAGMIEQAKTLYPDIDFEVAAAEDLNYAETFDVAFCNSALQWFKRPQAALQAISRALKKGGRLGVACPATQQWAPWFREVIEKAGSSPVLAPVFEHWQSPWFFLNSQDEYERLFAAQGFATLAISIDYELRWYTVEEAFGIYLSGAANGLTEKYYDITVSEEYIDAFNAAVLKEMARYAIAGQVPVDFNRLYYVGEKK